MKQKLKQLKSILLSLAMVLGLISGLSLTALADGTQAAGNTQETSDSSSATLDVAGFSVYGNAGVEPDAPENDTVNRRIKANLYMYIDEKSNLSSRAEYDAAVAAGAVIPETSGTWYLLLPENMTPDMSSVSLRGGDRIIEKEVYDNFRNSGQTLLVVRVALSPNVSDSYSGANGYFTDRISLSLDAYLPWEDYVDLEGNKYVDYYAAFESGNPGTLGNLPSDQTYYQSIGYPDAWPSITGTWLNGAPQAIKQVMTDLDPDTDEARFVYLYGSIGLGGIDITEQVEFRKDVRALSTDAWAKGTASENQVTVTEGGNYTYRMTVAAKQDSYIGGIMFYDAIEEFVPANENGLDAKKDWSGKWNGKGQWKGTLVSVDMTELLSKGFGPWLYYTEKTGLQFGGQNPIDTSDTHGILQTFDGWDGDYDLFNMNLWKRVPDTAIVNGVWNVPEDIHVAAIAVDAQRGTNPNEMCLLSPGDKVSVYLNMRAPSDGGDDSKWNAKGAYAHKTDSASSEDDIDWIAATDPANNMYAYNKAAAVYLRFSTPTSQASHGYARDRSVLDFEYTRTGIVPEIIMVRKTWNDKASVSGTGMVDNHDGLRPDHVTVKLKGVPRLPYGTALTTENNTTFEDTLVLTADDNWQGIFSNAPALDRNGVPYAYTVTEEPVPGYTTSVYKDGNRSYEIVNYPMLTAAVSTNTTLDGDPPSDPFQFELYETDANKTTEKKIAETQNDDQGNISFSVWIDPNDTNTYYYLIREVTGTDDHIEYDDKKEVMVSVKITTDSDNHKKPEVVIISSDGVFRNYTKKPATIVNLPAAKQGLIYDGTSQELISEGKTEEGNLQYALGHDGETVPTTGWSTSIPTATNAGTYYVWYKVIGDENHTDTTPACISVKIAEKPQNPPSTKETKTPDSPVKKSNASLLMNSGFLISWKGSKVQVKWGSVPKADRFDIYASYCGKSKYKKIATVHGKNSMTISKLKGKKLNPRRCMKVYVVAYSNGIKIGHTLTGHSAGGKNPCTNVKAIKVDRKTYKLRVGKTARIKAKTVKQNKKKKLTGHGLCPKLRYATSDPKVATVSKKGKIKAAGTGQCNIWIYAHNGRRKKVRVVVK